MSDFFKSYFLILGALFFLLGCSQYKDTYQVGNDMTPTIKDYGRVEIDLGAFNYDLPERWEVVYLKDSKNSRNRNLRVIGLPGETVKLNFYGLWVDGELIKVPGFSFGYNVADDATGLGVNEEVSVPENSYYVLGDNIGGAVDSRKFGFIESSKILGKVVSMEGSVSITEPAL